MTNYGAFSLGGNSSATIQPGIYSSISVSGNARLTMAPGIYIIEGGGFSVSGNASVTGSGVMIVNAGSNYPGTGGTYGSISLGGNATFNLSPATSGTYAGIVFFQPSDNTKAMTVTTNASGITGTIYAPGAALSESGNAALNASLIVKKLSISGNGIANGPSQAGPASAGISSNMVATSGGSDRDDQLDRGCVGPRPDRAHHDPGEVEGQGHRCPGQQRQRVEPAGGVHDGGRFGRQSGAADQRRGARCRTACSPSTRPTGPPGST